MGMLLGGKQLKPSFLFHNLPYRKPKQEQCLFIVSEEIEAVANKSTLYQGLLYRLVIAQTLKRPELMQVFVMTSLCKAFLCPPHPFHKEKRKAKEDRHGNCLLPFFPHLFLRTLPPGRSFFWYSGFVLF